MAIKVRTKMKVAEAEASIDLAVAVKFECGCFYKGYYEVYDPGGGFVDRDREYCGKHSGKDIDAKAERIAKEKADNIRYRLL